MISRKKHCYCLSKTCQTNGLQGNITMYPVKAHSCSLKNYMKWAKKGHPEKWLSILDIASVRSGLDPTSSWKFGMWHQSQGIKRGPDQQIWCVLRVEHLKKVLWANIAFDRFKTLVALSSLRCEREREGKQKN